MLKKFFATFLCVCLSFTAKAGEIDTIKACMQIEHETFLIWLAKEKGWDKQIDLNIDLNVTDNSGLEIVSEHKTDHKYFDICAIGALPSMIGCNENELEVVAIANNEAKSNEILVRADSDLLSVKGWNESYPDVYGSPETITGKVFFAKRLTHTSYLIARWLDLFYMNISDISLKNMNNYNAIDAMDAGHGDAMSIWAPECNEAEHKGYKKIVDLDQLGKVVPIDLVADVQFAKENPKTVAKFIAVYMRAVDYAKKKGNDLADDFMRFMKTYNPDLRPEFTKRVAEMTLERAQPYTYEESLKLFSKKNGANEAQKIHMEFSNYFILKGFIHFDVPKHIKYARYINDDYLLQAKEYYERTKDKD